MGEGTTAWSIEELMRHAGWARRLARGLAGGDDDDVFQDTIIAAVVRPPEKNRPIRAWLRRVLINHRIKRAQSDERRRRREVTIANETNRVAASPEELLGRLELHRILVEAVVSLPEPYRQTVLLRYYEDHSSQEIARILQVPAGTVRWRIKHGLDLLRDVVRRQVDDSDAAWMLLLVPTEPAPAVGVPRRLPRMAFAVAFALGIGGFVAVVFLWWRGPGPATSLALAPAPVSVVPLPAAAPVNQRSVEPPGLNARENSQLQTCEADVASLRQRAANAENEALSVISPHLLFTRGTPNQRAEVALAPEIERVLRAGRAEGPTYTLECRTWACRVTVHETDEELKRPDHWIGPLQRDAEIGFASPRVRRFMFWSSGRVRDPIADIPLNRHFVVFSLADSSGGRREYGKPISGAGFGRLPLIKPSTHLPNPSLSACAAERRILLRKLRTAEKDIEENRRPVDRFAAAKPNRLLTAEITGELSRLVSGPELGQAYKVECRSDVCRLGLEPLDRWRKAIMSDRQLRARFGAESRGVDWYVTIKSHGEMQTTRWLEDLLVTLIAAPEITACFRAHPTARGRLGITLAFHDLEPDPQVSGVGVWLRHELSGTVVADCVSTALRESLASVSPPAGSVPSLTTSASTTITLPMAPTAAAQ